MSYAASLCVAQMCAAHVLSLHCVVRSGASLAISLLHDHRGSWEHGLGGFGGP